MKTFYKTLMLGVFMAVLAVASPTFAQDVCADIEANQALYNQYIENYKGTLEQKETAVKAGNEYVQKYGACTDFSQQVDYLKRMVPKLEEEIKTTKAAAEKNARYERFNKAVLAKNSAEIFASGEDILKYEPDFLDVILVLASTGLDEAAEKKNNTFNDKAIQHAKSAIQKMESGVKSEKFGAYQYEYKNKENALGWMNYTIGYIEYYAQNKKDSGLNHLYKATQVNSETKDRAFIYALIGDKYVEQADALNKEIIELIKAADNKETFESRTKLALSKGYADRAIEAYAKAHEAAKKSKDAEYATRLFETLKGLYKFRYETVENPIPDTELVNKLNSHIASVTSKPLPSPNSTVQPVDPPTEEEESTDTDSSTTSSSTTSTPATTKAATNGAKTDANKTAVKPKQR